MKPQLKVQYGVQADGHSMKWVPTLAPCQAESITSYYYYYYYYVTTMMGLVSALRTEYSVRRSALVAWEETRLLFDE